MFPQVSGVKKLGMFFCWHGKYYVVLLAWHGMANIMANILLAWHCHYYYIHLNVWYIYVYGLNLRLFAFHHPKNLSNPGLSTPTTQRPYEIRKFKWWNLKKTYPWKRRKHLFKPIISRWIHVWYIELNLPWKLAKCRKTYHKLSVWEGVQFIKSFQSFSFSGHMFQRHWQRGVIHHHPHVFEESSYN